MSITLQRNAAPRVKSGRLIILPMLMIGLLGILVVLPWVRRLDLLDPWLAILCHINAGLWLIVLWWAFHHIVFQLAALFKSEVHRPSPDRSNNVSFAVVYLTCDDFQWTSCYSCIAQDYPQNFYRVLICDDSQDQTYIEMIDHFVAQHPQALLVRRPIRTGFKAGNLNYAFMHAIHATEEWVVVVDADQTLPVTYLATLAPLVAVQPREVAFVQANHDSDHRLPSNLQGFSQPRTMPTFFQQALGIEVEIFYQRDLSMRESYGFLPLLGHGAAIRHQAWKDVGGFPEVVSEDYAFALRTSTTGQSGVYVEEIRSWEAFPKDFGTFVTRLQKFAGGSAELMRYEVGKFLRSNVSYVEKLDFLMLLLWYPLMPLIVLNSFLSAYVCHRLWALNISPLHPLLPHLFVGMFIATIPVLLSVTSNLFLAARYWFWAVAVYTACLPVAGWHFFTHLWTRPTFVRTPKGSDRPPSFRRAASVLVLLGVLTVGVSWYWRSPFSPVLAAHGIAYGCFPLYMWLDKPTPLGRLMHAIVWIPGALLLIALYTMWLWGKF